MLNLGIIGSLLNQNNFTVLSPATSFTANAVHWTGSYMNRGATLTGIANGTVGLLSFWIKMNGDDGQNDRILLTGNSHVDVTRQSTNAIEVQLFNAAGTRIVDCQIGQITASNATWKHIFF